MRSISRGAVALKGILKPEQALTQKQLAEKLGVTQQAVSAWLRGAARPDHRRMLRLEELLSVPVSAWDEAAADDESGALPADDTEAKSA